MSSTSGLPTPRRARAQTVSASSGISMAAPVRRPFQNAQRGFWTGRIPLERALAVAGFESPMVHEVCDQRKPLRLRTVACSTCNPARGFDSPDVQSPEARRMTATSNPNRAYSAAHFALELDNNQQVGLFRSIEGGSIKADVMTYQNGQNYDRWRQLGKPKFEDIKIQTGMSMSEAFYAWIENFFTGVPDRKNGAIVAADFNYMERARREFKEAMIKELTFPKLDGQDKNPAYMTVALAVEQIVFLPGTNRDISEASNPDKQKNWASCNFRFTLD